MEGDLIVSPLLNRRVPYKRLRLKSVEGGGHTNILAYHLPRQVEYPSKINAQEETLRKSLEVGMGVTT